MPKIIPGLQEALLTQAKQIFSKKGYSQTELRDVAAAAGTSVGNIYNYYTSKPHLFLAVTEVWRQELEEKILALLDLDLDPAQKLYQVFELQYYQATHIQGLWKEFFKDGLKAHKDESCRNLWSKLEEKMKLLHIRIEAVLLEANPDLKDLPGDSEGRWSSLVLFSVLHLPIRNPGQEEANLQFLKNLISVLIRKNS